LNIIRQIELTPEWPYFKPGAYCAA